LKKNFLKIVFIIFAILFIYFSKTNFSEYNLEKSISACVLAQKQKSESFNLEKTKKFCEEEIRKLKENWTAYLKEAAILPPSTVSTAPVVFFEIAKWKNALATSSAFTSFNNKFPFI